MAQNSENASNDVSTRLFERLERTISPYRFRRYVRETQTQEEAISLYLWNIALCESLYPTLNFFEIALRNTLHRAFTETHSQDVRWFMDPLFLKPHHQEQVAKALQSLREQRKPVDPLGNNQAFPLEPERVVAELNLGFWVNLCSDAYAGTSINGHLIFPYVINKAFPRASRRAREHHYLYPRLKEQMNLRNRIFHHEPIYHWRNLSEIHASLYDLLSWIEPEQIYILQAIDRFKKTYEEGASAFQFSVEYATLSAVEDQIL
jgi:Abi-like protein